MTAPERLAPHNIEVEQMLLGAILVNNEAAAKVSTFLRAENFYAAVHGLIFDAATKLIERGQIATPLTLDTFLKSNDLFADLGGVHYLADMVASAVTVINAEKYGRLVFDLAVRRDLIGIGQDMVNVAFESPIDVAPSEQIYEVERHLFELAQRGEREGGFQGLATSMRAAIDTIDTACKSDGHLSGISTGYKDLDGLLGGLHKSDLIILAGRPSMGKTALVTNIAVNAAKSRTDGKRTVVGFFSLEMSAEQLSSRILSNESRIPSEKLRRGDLDLDQFQKLVIVSQEFEELQLLIDDTPALSVAALRTRARRLKRKKDLGLDLVIIDYLQLVRPSGASRNENRVQEVSEITQSLKAMAKELEVPVIALSQLSRQVESRDDKRPLLSDLRESGSIEQDADVVMFVFREEYYHSRTSPSEDDPKKIRKWLDRNAQIQGLAEVIVGKQRHGPIGTVKLGFESSFASFRDYEG